MRAKIMVGVLLVVLGTALGVARQFGGDPMPAWETLHNGKITVALAYSGPTEGSRPERYEKLLEQSRSV